MNKQQVEKSLQKLMKTGSFYGGAREPKGGVGQGKLPPTPQGERGEAARTRKTAPANKAREDANKAFRAKYRSSWPGQEPFVNPKEAMEKAEANRMPTSRPHLAYQRPEDPAFQPSREIGIGDRQSDRGDIKFRSSVPTHSENLRMPTPEDPRTQSDFEAPAEESNGFGMGDLETRIAGKTRNKPTHGVRMRKPPVDDYRRNREGPPEGRKVTEQGATPSFSASLKALNKMLEGGFLSKKADPAMAAQSRSATRQRGAATQERIAGQAASGAQAVQGPSDRTAQDIGSDIASNVSWAAQQAWAETHPEEGKPQAQPGTQQWNQQQQEGDDDTPNVSSVQELTDHVKNEGKAAGVQDANTPGTSGLYGPTGGQLPSSSKLTQDMTNPPKTGGFNPADKGMSFKPKTGPTTKPNIPDLTNPSWKQASK